MNNELTILAVFTLSMFIGLLYLISMLRDLIKQLNHRIIRLEIVVEDLIPDEGEDWWKNS